MFFAKPSRLMLAAAVVAGGASLAIAQQSPMNPGLPPAIAVPPGSPQAAPMQMPMRMGPTENQIRDEANARIAMLKANLRLTPEQEGKWGALETALRDIMVTRVKARLSEDADRRAERQMRHQQGRQHRWSDMQTPPTAPQPQPQAEASQRPSEMARMRTQADRMAQRAAELHRVADAADPLYASLDQRQRGMLIGFLQRGFGRGGERR